MRIAAAIGALILVLAAGLAIYGFAGAPATAPVVVSAPDPEAPPAPDAAEIERRMNAGRTRGLPVETATGGDSDGDSVAVAIPEAPEIIVGAPEPAAAPAPPPFAEDETHRDVGIYLATNRTRAAAPDPDDPASLFTDQNGPLTWGVATISIPRDHRMGNLESQGWLAQVIGLSPDPERHVILQEMTPLPFAEAMDRLARDLGTTDNSILMYVHGFNTSLDKAARRTGQLAYDLTWQGPTLLFAWPSMGSGIRYFHDSTMADRSVPALEQVFRDLAAQEPDRIIVISHSMGTRITSAAIANLIRDRDPALARISTVVLAAPDIDEQVFRDQIAPRFLEVTRPHITLYASAEDEALKISKRANGFPRIGDTTNGVPVIAGIDVIDASGVTSDFFNHTYFGDNATILSDIYDMIHADLPVGSRPMLSPMPPETDPPSYWQILTGN